jgi:hypothetical protein
MADIYWAQHENEKAGLQPITWLTLVSSVKSSQRSAFEDTSFIMHYYFNVAFYFNGLKEVLTL